MSKYDIWISEKRLTVIKWVNIILCIFIQDTIKSITIMWKWNHITQTTTIKIMYYVIPINFTQTHIHVDRKTMKYMIFPPRPTH